MNGGLWSALAKALPPAFLLLVVILGIVFWHEAQQDRLRTDLIARLIDRCLPHQTIEPRQGSQDELKVPRHPP